ncbi:hypothetical protein [Streptomyces hokutonensis]|uniref:hypothetical protein n=1 Tax=Streptomyces hokutonensis TaxID=1306990 RepID=UPI001319FAFB|nr:hypothetical protein [Streptomyces hokutonensis]
MTMDPDARWHRWCEAYDASYRDITTLFHNRHVWLTFEEMWKAPTAIELNTIVINWFTRLYVATQVAGVRRECDPGTNTSSLRWCLDELVKFPQIASRVRYESAIDEAPAPDDEQKAGLKEGFDLFAGRGQPHIEAQRVQADIDTLVTTFDTVRGYTNKILLHRQRNGATLGLSLSWEELDTALNVVGVMLKRYYRLRHPGSVLGNLAPELPLGWTVPFEVPWLPEGFVPLSARPVEDHVGPGRRGSGGENATGEDDSEPAESDS